MKNCSLFFVILFSAGLLSAQTMPLQVNFKFRNIEEGYDHLTRTVVFIDNQELGMSDEVLQSKGATFTVNVPKGTHDLRVVNMARYEGVWEEHTIENNYSIDCLFSESRHNFKKAEKLFLVFDLDSGTTAAWKKKPKG